MKALALRLLAATAIATAAVSAASAADLPMRAAPPAPFVAAAPIFTWTGFYVGANAGYGWSDDDHDTVALADEDDDGGFVGGAQIGYNYQIGSFVVGLEGDIQYADFGREGAFDTNGNGTIDDDDGVFESSDWFGTVRARAGVALGQALIYGTGGFAFADDSTGWTAGGGLEYAFTNNLSARIEGLYVSLDGDDNDIIGFDNETDFGVVRAGLNFRFGSY